jgi:hypothetical protein
MAHDRRKLCQGVGPTLWCLHGKLINLELEVATRRQSVFRVTVKFPLQMQGVNSIEVGENDVNVESRLNLSTRLASTLLTKLKEEVDE